MKKNKYYVLLLILPLFLVPPMLQWLDDDPPRPPYRAVASVMKEVRAWCKENEVTCQSQSGGVTMFYDDNSWCYEMTAIYISKQSRRYKLNFYYRIDQTRFLIFKDWTVTKMPTC